MSYRVVSEFPHPIIEEKEGPFISIYQETHRSFSENRKDMIVYKNLLKDVESSLKKDFDKREVSALMEPLRSIAEDRQLWDHMEEGLAILSHRNDCVIYRLPEAVETKAIVANSFHIKPLIHMFQSVDRYHILALTAKSFKLYQGNQLDLKEVELDPSIKVSVEDVLGDQYTDPYLTHGTYGGPGQNTNIYHGHGGEKAESEKDIERYFRYVDDVILSHYSKPMKLPLILLAVKEHHGEFMKISDNPYLMNEGIKASPSALTMPEIKKRVWDVIEPIYKQKIDYYQKSFEQAYANGLAAVDLQELVKRSAAGRIETLFVEENHMIPGTIDPVTQEITYQKITDPSVDDVLDDLAQRVFAHKGKVLVLAKEHMPRGSSVAGIYRY
ncbi:MAG: hypothetical protein ACLFSU_05360 [Acholeplasmataceae bacterium]